MMRGNITLDQRFEKMCNNPNLDLFNMIHLEYLVKICLVLSKIKKLCKNPAMLFHEDMIYLAKEAKHNVEKSFALR